MVKSILKKRVAMVLVTGFIFSLTSGISFGEIKAYADASIGAHHEVVGDDVFLGGNFIEVGVSKGGSFGTLSAAPAGFHPVSRTNLGMVADGDGFDVGNEPNTGDFFLPGGPYESYVVAYKDAGGTVTKAQVAERNGILQITDISTTDTSSGDTLSATTVGTTTDGKLEITQVISFDVNDKYFNINVTYHNISGDTIYDARYLRSVDPDQDLDRKGSFSTKNSVIKNPPEDDMAIVIAKGAITEEPFIYMAADSRARASVTSFTDPYSSACYDVDGSNLLKEETTADTWIAITFALGDIAAGDSVSLDLKNSLNPNIDEALEEEPQVTTPAAVQITRNEDTLTAQLKKEDGSNFTTSAAVTYDWYRDNDIVDGENNDTYIISDDDKGKDIKVKVEQYDLESNSIHIDEDIIMPTGVEIRGTQKVRNLLTAELVKDGGDFTPDSDVEYRWYRLNTLNSEFTNLIGTSKTYTLSSLDRNKYIGVLVTYKEIQFENKTSVIIGSSSHSNSGSNNSQTKPTTDGSDKSTDGWKANDKEQKYIKDGQPVTGWNKINGSWYLMNTVGNMQTGWQKINDSWYYLKDDGVMTTGWQKLNNDWYYLKGDGVMTTGWQQSNNNWYYLKNDGAMANGWIQSDNKWYLLNSDGSMATGWQQSNGKWYYLYNDGSMASNTIVDGYAVDANGAWI